MRIHRYDRSTDRIFLPSPTSIIFDRMYLDTRYKVYDRNASMPLHYYIKEVQPPHKWRPFFEAVQVLPFVKYLLTYAYGKKCIIINAKKRCLTLTSVIVR